MSEGRSRRRTAQQSKSYRHDDVFKFLDPSDSEASGEGGSESEAGNKEKETNVDEFIPEDEEDEADDMDEFNDAAIDDDEGDSDRASDAEDAQLVLTPSKPSRPKKATRPPPSPATPKKRLPPAIPGPPNRLPKGLGSKVRQRGAVEWGTGGQEMRWRDLFGPADEDIKPVFQARDTWLHLDTLPTRKQRSLRNSFFLSQAGRENDITATRKWLEDIGRDAFAVGQVTKQLDGEERCAFMTDTEEGPMHLLMGDLTKPRLYHLEKGGYMKTSAPFNSDSKRRGWILNLGARVQEAQWVPNEEGHTQYLAVAVEPKQAPERRHEPMENPEASAFTATKPFPASIQIWAFDSTKNGELDTSRPPRLEQVICAEWGAPKAFRWSPVATKDSVESSDNTVHLGLLAGIWSDGKLRILNVSHSKSGAEVPKTQYIYYSRAAFEVKLPDTIPTCLHWLSGNTISLTTASGYLAIWTLSHAGIFPSNEDQGTATSNPRPWFYKQLCETYILTFASGYPSKPSYISITTADGFGRVFDLRSIAFDSSWSLRGRMLIFAQAWHDQTQTFCSADEHYLLKHNSIRRYYAHLYSMRLPSSITCVATSPVHPCILLGGSDGMVASSSPVAKILNQKEVPWQQPWFKHEWRRPTMNLVSHEQDNRHDERYKDPTLTSNNDSPTALRDINKSLSQHSPSPIAETTLRLPLIRISEGYKAQQVGLQHAEDTKRLRNGANILSIFEEKSAITRLAWNPNLRYGTWAVAGTNSGYLRVEDIGV